MIIGIAMAEWLWFRHHNARVPGSIPGVDGETFKWMLLFWHYMTLSILKHFKAFLRKIYATTWLLIIHKCYQRFKRYILPYRFSFANDSFRDRTHACLETLVKMKNNSAFKYSAFRKFPKKVIVIGESANQIYIKISRSYMRRDTGWRLIA